MQAIVRQTADTNEKHEKSDSVAFKEMMTLHTKLKMGKSALE